MNWGNFLFLIVFILLFSVGCSNNKINVENSSSVEDGSQVIYDELKAEFVGYANQFVLRTTYIFENDKAIACYMETESNNELYLKQIDPSLEKNFRREGNIVYYEWSDEYFEKKGKGCSRKVIEKFLKDSGFKIIKQYNLVSGE